LSVGMNWFRVCWFRSENFSPVPGIRSRFHILVHMHVKIRDQERIKYNC
jgi:hypothetical protein